MNCPKCGYGYSTVKNCRTVGMAKRRRHTCSNCGYKYTGYEMYGEDYQKMVKENSQARKIMKILEEFANAKD